MGANDQAGIQPLAFKSKADAVYERVRQLILEGQLAPASSLNQEQLAATLEVSTTPLREALRRLEAEGFVRNVAHREITVAPLLIDEVVALYEVRRDLDPLAAGLAAERYGPSDRDRMTTATQALRDSTGEHEAVARNREFHTAIYHACHNPVLIELLDGLWDRADRYRRLITVVASAKATLAEHEALLQAVLDRRADEAAQLMRAHLVGSGGLIEQSLRAGVAGSTTPA